MKNYQITEWCHHFIAEQVKEGDICIDATMGNGNDTEFLCGLVGESGKVYAFDIQEQAVEATRKRLSEAGFLERAELFCASHAEMDVVVNGCGDGCSEQRAVSRGKRHVAKSCVGDVSCIVFNFGYLPGGDHHVATNAETSIAAIEKGLCLLKKQGVMSLCIYSGGDSGFEERDALLPYLKTLDPKKYLVIVSEYYNRPNNPPIPVMIVKR